MRMVLKKGQIWVETVIYTLIGLAIIGIVLALATPAINKNKDKLILEQTMTIMMEIDNKIKDVRDSGAGNKRIIDELSIRKGYIEIDGENNEIKYVLEGTRLEYSEPEKPVQQGSINILTNSISGGDYNIILTLEYPSLNITYSNDEDYKKLTAASIPYKLSLHNNGTTDPNPDPTVTGDEQIWILVKEIS